MDRRMWFVRNEITHNKKRPSTFESVSFLRSYADSLAAVKIDMGSVDDKGKKPILTVGVQRWDSPASVRTPKKKANWQKPQPGWVKINVDGAFSPNSGKAGIGVVIRNEAGAVELCSWRVLFDATSVEQTEAQACLESINLAAEWVRKKALVEMDCANVVQVLNSKAPNKSPMLFLMEDIQEARSRLPDTVRSRL